MPYIPPSVMQEVKRMDLLAYLKNYEPYELVHFSGNTYTTSTLFWKHLHHRNTRHLENIEWKMEVVEQRNRWQISTGLSDQSKRIQLFRGG